MKKVISGIKKYTPYVLLLLGIWIVVTFFIAGGIKTSEKVMNPSLPAEQYHFTIFQLMFGKGFRVLGENKIYFRPNFFGFTIIIPLISGLIIATINKINYKTRHLLAGMLLLISGLSLFLLPANAQLGYGWNDRLSVVVTGGAALIVAGTLILVFSLINFLLIFLADKKVN
ncbi:MAG: hypothetical protein ACOX5X_03360 [Acholeplasmataceae bacterium]|jgi:hypothetical protein